MIKEQDPMTGFKTLEQAFATGWRMRRVSFTTDIFVEKDKALGADRYTYAKLLKLKVQQTVVLNEVEPLNDLPCFQLFYGTLESLRGQGLTVPFITKILAQFNKDLPNRYKKYYLEVSIDKTNLASIAVAKRLFGEHTTESVDRSSGNTPIFVWQKLVDKKTNKIMN